MLIIKERDIDPYSKPRCFIRYDRAFFISSLRNNLRIEWKCLIYNSSRAYDYIAFCKNTSGGVYRKKKARLLRNKRI